jgi:hypothetical protein
MIKYPGSNHYCILVNHNASNTRNWVDEFPNHKFYQSLAIFGLNLLVTYKRLAVNNPSLIPRPGRAE